MTTHSEHLASGTHSQDCAMCALNNLRHTVQVWKNLGMKDIRKSLLRLLKKEEKYPRKSAQHAAWQAIRVSVINTVIAEQTNKE